MPKPQDAYAYPPRGMDAERAAAYVGLSRSKWLELVDAGDAPAPLDLGGCPRWDRQKIDHWLDVKANYVKKSAKTMAEVLEERRGNAQAEVRKQLQRPARQAPPLLSKARVA
jgi:predicted DNA-binding transcriptional regulator AlpA